MEEEDVNSRRVFCYFECCQQLVKRAHAHFSEEKKLGRNIIGLNRVQDRVSATLGIGRTTLNKLLTRDDLPKPGEAMKRAREMCITDEDLRRVRPAFMSLLRKKEHVTLTKLQKELASDTSNPWPWGRTSLWKILKRIGFEFSSRQKGYYARLRENPDNIALRGAYLTKLEEYKEQSRQIVYMDESWINKNITPKYVWHDNSLETVDAVPSGKGQRWIMIGAGTKEGWVENSFRIWKGTQKNEDYHTEMNADVMNDWMEQYLLPNVRRDAVIVVDRAPYHTACSEDTSPPQANWKKQKLAEYILEHSNNYSEDQMLNEPHGRRNGMLKSELYRIAREVAPPKQLRLQVTVNRWNERNQTDIKILLLPIAHPQLNPIEMVWSWVKVEVGKRNKSFTMTSVKNETIKRVGEINATQWNAACNKSDAVAVEYMEVDDIEEDSDDDHEESDVQDDEDDDSLED
jgi:transposase